MWVMSGVRQRRMVPHTRDPLPHEPLMPGHTLDAPASYELLEATPIQLDTPNPRQSNNNSNCRTKTRHKKYHADDKISETSVTEPLLTTVSSSSEEEEEIYEVTEVGTIDDEVEVELVDKLPEPDEAAWQIALQIFFPYIVAGLGMVAAGMLLDVVQVGRSLVKFSWSVAVCMFLCYLYNIPVLCASSGSDLFSKSLVSSRPDMVFSNDFFF